VVLVTCPDYSASQLQSHFSDNPKNVTLGTRGIGTHNKIRGSKDVEVGGMVSYVERAVKEFTKFLGCAGGFNVKQIVQGLGGCHMVGFGADSADALGYLRHILGRASLRKFLETPQFRNLEINIGYATIVVKEDGNFAMAFEPGDGVYHYFLHFILALLSNEAGRL
jgi:hypothetical protein